MQQAVYIYKMETILYNVFLFLKF